MKNDPLKEQALAKGEDKELTFKRKTSRTRCWRAVNCGKWLNGEKKKMRENRCTKRPLGKS